VKKFLLQDLHHFVNARILNSLSPF